MHKKVLRQHRILFRVLILTFNISLIALTATIVLGAAKAHQVGQNGAKCAAIIVAQDQVEQGPSDVIHDWHERRNNGRRLEVGN